MQTIWTPGAPAATGLTFPFPLHLTSDPIIDWIVLGVSLYALIYGLRYLRLAREGVRHQLSNILMPVLVVAFFGTLLINVLHLESATTVPLLAIITVIAILLTTKQRSRYISAAVKRAVIARDLGDEPYDSNKHHFDHKVAFSRGGGNTVDNLRIISKKDNQRKGRKNPRLRDMWS